MKRTIRRLEPKLDTQSIDMTEHGLGLRDYVVIGWK